jgi:hypothetical protein
MVLFIRIRNCPGLQEVPGIVGNRVGIYQKFYQHVNSQHIILLLQIGSSTSGTLTHLL